jgi:cytosine/adenosine deaminase-related metal-dependent hydrolase
MHLDESRNQRQEAFDVYGHSSIHHLDDLGLLNNRLSLAHCVWVDDDDLELIAMRDTTVVHNPVSNLRLGNGVAPVPEMLRRGIAVALGSDGAASNDGQNMFEVMKVASLLPGATGFRERPTVRDILSMTTGSVGERFGMHGIGSIAMGQQADLVVFDAADSRLHPRNDIHKQIVFGGAGLTVRHVVIGGRVVVCDGKIQTFDESEIFTEADTITLRAH